MPRTSKSGTSPLTRAGSREEIEQSLADMKRRGSATSSQEELNQIKKSIKILEQKLKRCSDNYEVDISEIHKTLEQSNCFNKQQRIKEFESLKFTSPHLYEYANNFYWILSNYFLACRSITSGVVQGLRDKSKLEKKWETIVPLVIKASESIPVAGGIIALIEEAISLIAGSYKDSKFEYRIQKINIFIKSFKSEEDLNLAVKTAAYDAATIKSQVILALYEIPVTTEPLVIKTRDLVKNKIKKLNDKLDKLINKIIKAEEIIETPANKEAIQDVILLLNYLMTLDIDLSNLNLREEINKIFTTDIMIQKDGSKALEENNNIEETDSQSNAEITGASANIIE